MNIELKETGYHIIRNVIDDTFRLCELKEASIKIFDLHRTKYGAGNGVGLHAILNDDIFIQFLSQLIQIEFIDFIEKEYFNSTCIVNSFSVLNTIKNSPNFSAQPHRDLRFYTPLEFPMMLNCLVMLDNFTQENGGTYILPKSHLKREMPTNEEFFKDCVQVTGNAGDILIFDSNVVHASGINQTNDSRIAMPITFSRPSMKQLIDIPRAFGYDKISEFPEKMQRLLGYHSRVPSTLEEWYLPTEQRFYRKGND